MTDTQQKSPAELRAERFDRLRSEWDRVRDRVSLAHLNDELEDTGSKITGLPHQVAELRKRGYRYSGDWEARAETLSDGWPGRRREAQRLIREQAQDLEGLTKEVEYFFGRSSLSEGELNRLENKLDRLQSQVSSAESNVRGAFDALEEQIYALEREFRRVEFLLDSLDTASFDIYPDEYGVAASEATWTNHPDEPKGILFLTNGRLLFEQREKKAKKKVLFITTESELIQEKMWETPIGNVDELEAEDKKKFLSKKELLHLGFREYASTGLHGDVTLDLDDTTNEEWAGLIKRVQRDEIAADRYDKAPEAEPAADAAPPPPPSEIPTKCPACGGQLPPLVKGMREIICDYCSTSVRVG